ncbi:MAG: biopolymer transporter ExbD [Candidatus Dactylopiibacterium carminicum]|uniref:Biopolymer transporter ExbD n=1 Tax=Candidatus Dactylopiibacterium carminicum TaxID=857335 RepID=A0A272ENZ3_9RHOO|nr:biopolymer transporter ExbD [Candidatus Dactylopiibacterium carminicum]KAF7598193.1 biopolymer transporter ExbD [Candidatus Dactylopiibacterium carminicum]PAS91845.1 MAG: biopolymer transporter ExbD [Candidatus Dactylopiibacterium carminicum]PAS94616.1 MAG: biopolymer transporter ExbD [Candidatus Dactylopiibacterium carminicum]PAS96911.1 MAG: biopolymer transporter ExbD [Candidatus Dactylopiibacterium carminicum]
MNFRRGQSKETLEINLIPLIDVLLVIIIFLMLTTTYSRFSGLEINLPTSDGTPSETQNNEINVTVTASGDILVNRNALASREPGALVEALRRAAPEGGAVPLVVINGDAKANFQSVFDVMQAAQKAGLPNVSFASQSKN